MQYNIDITNTTRIDFHKTFVNFHEITDGQDFIIISDKNIHKHYKEQLLNCKTILIETGERYKSQDTISFIISELIKYNANKNTILIGFGGGVVTDITGYVANIFKRGIKLKLVPTSLIAQIDASIGGKNGINHGNIKNAIGSFYNPESIHICTQYLKTLNNKDFISGFGEIIKYALIANNGLMNLMDKVCFDKCDFSILEECIYKCIETKISIIEKDPFDKGIRRILNFGHTFGHCFELINNIKHGTAIAMGILIAIDISEKKSHISSEIASYIRNIIKKQGFSNNYVLTEEHLNLLVHDKKVKSSNINFVFIQDVGAPVVEEISIDELTRLVKP